MGTVVRVAAGFAWAISVASAHHNFSVHYDENKFGTLTGKIAAVQWTNPHVVLALDVKAADGKTQRWMIEGYPPSTLFRQGWQKDSLRIGDQITISGWHARDQTLKIFWGREVTFGNGSKRLIGSLPSDAWKCPSGDCTDSWIPSITQ